MPASLTRPGEEAIPAGEAEWIAQVVAIQRQIQEEVDRLRMPVPRSQHPKGHGCVRAEFVVEPGLPDGFRHGVFRELRTFSALIRFSNGAQTDDRKKDIHGMAIKLLGVKGLRLLDSDPDATTQDFILMDSPFFFLRNAEESVPAMKDLRRLRSPGLSLGKLASIVRLLVLPRYRPLLKANSKRPGSPLDISYWSATPYRLGQSAVKFSTSPVTMNLGAIPPRDSPDKLRLAMVDRLRDREARFDFLVQVQADPATMPVEDPTVEWDERAAPFRKVATIVIPPQVFDTPEQQARCEALSFTPWNGLAEHRPLGGINRTRKAVYEVLSRRRHELNGVPMTEPSTSAADLFSQGTLT